MTKSDIEFLENLRKELLTQTNDGTANPVWWGVMETETEYGFTDGFATSYELYNSKTYDSLGQATSTEELINLLIKEGYSKTEFADCTSMDFVMSKLPEHYQLIGIQEKDHLNTGCLFLTKKDCLNYIKSYGYNHNKPRSYAMSATRCDTFARLLNILKSTHWDDILESEWIDDHQPPKNGIYLVMYHEYAPKDDYFPLPHNVTVQRTLRFKDGEWAFPVNRHPELAKRLHKEVLAWKPLGPDYTGENLWKTWRVVAYDKDHDYYKIIKTGSKSEMIALLMLYHDQCKNDKLLNTDCGNEPFDTVFIEPDIDEYDLPRYYVEDILAEEQL